jgi:O-antigen ligase
LRDGNRDRIELVQAGWNLFKSRVFFGHGLKADYRALLAHGLSRKVHVHNGLIGVLLEGGVIGLAFPLYFIVNAITRYTFRLRIIHVVVMLFMLLRAYGESYFFYNIGNLPSLVFLIIVISYAHNNRLYTE